MKALVYSGILAKEELIKIIQGYFREGEVFNIMGDPLSNNYQVDSKLPPQIEPLGRVFSDKGEIRWQEKEEGYFTMLLTDEAGREEIRGLSLIEGKWEIDETHNFSLVNPQAHSVSPPFESYPKEAEKIEAMVYFKEGIPCLIRLKGFKNDGEKRS